MTDMKNFIYNGMNVRTAVVNGESWFVAADICRPRFNRGYSGESRKTCGQ